ncbi:Clavaminate synthase-like protein, partial [Rhizodiscina lignyota]
PEVKYEQVMESDNGVADWLMKIRSYGFCYVDGCPSTPEATKELLEKIAFIRNTHYGKYRGFWDFTSDLSKGDTAYTDLAIGPHTDNTYFTDPAGLQMFHLLSHEDGEGGMSGLVDGFAAASELSREFPEDYRTLSSVNVHCHASGNDGSSIQPATGFPVLVHDHRYNHLIQIRWNPADRAQVDVPVDEVQNWYRAARRWTETLKKYEFWEQLRPGRPLIFDNWRALHARTAFTGKRRMCGGYINHDDYISRFKSTNWGNSWMLETVSLG